MGDLKGGARAAMAAKLITDVVTAEGKPVKVDLLGLMTDAEVERVRVTDDDGENLGAVTVACGKPAAKVVDERAFTAWVAARHPSELTQVVREAFAKKLLDAATARCAAVDAEGEVIPGVEIATPEPYLTVRPAAGARERMREILLGTGLLQLPAAGGQP